LDPTEVNSLVALVSLHAQQYATCSQAISSLELQENNSEYFAKLAIDIFSKNKPKNQAENMVACGNCLSSVTERFGLLK
jgi:hypothetical protein